jgi:tetratricopeptide (TPR) repeat protein
MGALEESERCYREAIAIDRSTGYAIGLAINLNNLSELLLEDGRHEEVAPLIREGMDIAEGVDVHLVPYLELNQARLDEIRGSYESAEGHAREALRLARSYRQSSLESRAESRLGSVAIHAGRLEDAAQHASCALAIGRAAADPASSAHALAVCARLHRAQGAIHRARAFALAVLAHEGAEEGDRKVARRLLAGPTVPVLLTRSMSVDNERDARQ